MKKTPRTWPELLHDILGSTGRTLRAVMLLASISLLAGGSPELLHTAIQLLHR